MLEAGLADEARKLATDYGWECVALQTIGYQEFRQYFEGTHSIEQVREEIVRDTLRYAKRQRTWFRRNQDIHWLCKEAEAVDLITSLLNK
jgi:tRNA dimethylallyltransferase